MDSRDLTIEQLRQLSANLLAPVRQFQRLINRMQELSFPDDDPLLLLALKAQDAASKLRAHAHTTAYDLEWYEKHRGQGWREAQQS